jgi:hypothetical protein
MSKGYILLARQLLRHPRFKPRGPFTQFEAWYWLIESAAFAPCEVPIMTGTRREMITLQPGQLSHSIRFLSAAWRWSPNRVQRFLRDLAMDGSVNTQTDTAQTLITLCNWDKYQRPFSEANTQADTQTDTQTDTKKKELKEKKDRAPKSAAVPEGFAAWFAIYPNAIEQPPAERNFKKVMKSGVVSLEELMAATARYAAKIEREKRDTEFIKKPANWLRDGCFDDGQKTELAPVVDPRTFTNDQWQRRLKPHQDSGAWSENWGPEPGEPGCLVPSHLLLAPVSNSKGAA